MDGKVVRCAMIAVLLTTMLTLPFNIWSVKAEASEPPATEWSRTYGGASIEMAFSVVQTSDGGYALLGDTRSFGAGDWDFWLIKTDAAGNMLWNKTYGGAQSDYISMGSLVQTSDGGYALAGFTESFGAGTRDFWLVKTDTSGNMEWNKTYGGTSGDAAVSVVQTIDGGYALAGATESFGAGQEDAWLVKTDAIGNAQWNKTYGGTGLDSAAALVQTADGGYALAGLTESFGAGTRDFWLIKTDANGNAQWDKTYGGTGEDWARALVQTSDGGYALAGVTSSFGAGYRDFWLVKTDASGNLQWDKTWGGTGQDEADSLVQTGDGGYALAGFTESFGAGMWDAWVIKTDSSGNMMWNKTYGGMNFDEFINLILTSDGGYALAGFTYSFGTGSYDAWLIKLAPEIKPPIAEFAYSPLDPYVGETVTFDASTSYDPDGTIVSYLWNFGDGASGNGVVTTHVYAAGGTYTVALTAIDNEGLNSTVTTEITVLRTTVNVQVKAGSIHFRGEIAEFYVLVSSLGKPIDANLNATLYYNGTLYENLSTSVEHVSLGIYRIPYTIPLNAPTGTYALVVNATYLTLSGISLESFLLSPTLTSWNPLLVSINETVATIRTDLGLIEVKLDTINATVVSISGTTASIQTSLGLVTTDIRTINTTVMHINGTTADIQTTLGTVKLDIDDIQLKVIAINGTTATIQTVVGVMNGTITSIKNNIATIVIPDIGQIETDISSLKGTQETWTIPVQYVITVLALIAAAGSTLSIILLRRRKTS
jgi:PKD repeat protein